MYTSELERLADDSYRDRLITNSVYCGGCGYNLQTLPYMYRCPECGQEYNARPLVMKNIFLPDSLIFPSMDLFTTLLCTGFSIVALIRGWSNGDANWWGVGVVFGVLGILYVWRSYRLLVGFVRGRIILRRIEHEEG